MIVLHLIMLLILFMAVVSNVHCFEYYKRCLFYQGACVTNCPPNMHPYHTRCDQDTMSQRTCDSPYVYSLGYSCGWSRCDCNGDLAFDEDSGHCVEYNYCPATPRRRRKSRRKDRIKLKSKIRSTESPIPEMQ